MKHKRYLVLLLLLIVGIIVTCSRKLDRAQVVGLYVANQDLAIVADSLELKDNGTYIHYYESVYGEQFADSGLWTFDIENGSPDITFKDFKGRLLFKCFSYEKDSKAYWHVTPRLTILGRVKLIINGDVGCCYIKIR